ncbi:MAG TPA: SAM-dependent methyltransferase, partial [Dissulfurispiraceae bacterium]
MSTLEKKIIEKIKSEGPINFEVFMDMALYEPGLGYYTNESTTIGRAGDFYTSPHLHPIFGAMLGRQMEEMWKAMGSPATFDVIEMGAGMGWLAKDMLDYLSGTRGRQSALFPHLRYAIVELNESVRLRQKERLKEHAEKLRWIAGLKDAGRVAGCILSNELLDAFPVRLVEMDGELQEIYVAEQEGGLVEVKRPCSDEVRDYFRGLSIELPEGYRTEVNLRMRDWLREVSAALSEGFLLTVDYGYPAWDYY